MSDKTPNPRLGTSLAIILFLLIAFAVQIITIGEPDVHITLVFATVFAVLLLMVVEKVSFDLVEEGILHGAQIATISMMILMFIGVMIPAWIGAGTIPVLIYYGLKVISPDAFLITAFLICAVSTLCTGTSWGSAATFGVALMGIGSGLGISAPHTAAAIVCGCIFGDKMSPVSDTVNLSSGTCEVDVYDHIKAVAVATIPGALITLVVFFFLQRGAHAGGADASSIQDMLDTLAAHFNVTPLYALIALIPMLLILVLALLKVHSLATIVISAMVAMLIAVFVQGYGLVDMMAFMNYGFIIETGSEAVDGLLNRGGLQSMMWTVSLGYLGLSYGGILEKTGVLNSLLFSLDAITRNSRNLILSQILTGFIVIMLSASPYVSILIPGRMFIAGYDKLGIDRTVCSRTLEHSGICLDPLLPWTLGGVYFAGVLGVDTLAYAPYAVMLYVIPVIAAFYAVTGLFVNKAPQGPQEGGPEHA